MTSILDAFSCSTVRLVLLASCMVPIAVAWAEDRGTNSEQEVRLIVEDGEVNVSEKLIEKLSEKIEKSPADAQAYYDRGTAYLALADGTGSRVHLRKAIDDFSNALRADNTMMKAYNNRALAYQRMGAYDEAMRDLKKAIDLEPNNAALRLNRAIAMCHYDAYQLALDEIDIAVKLDPKNAMAWSQRGVICRGLRRRKEALRSFKKAIEIDPGVPMFYSNRGNVHQDLEEYDAALRDYDKAIALDPGFARTFRNRAELYERQKSTRARRNGSSDRRRIGAV